MGISKKLWLSLAVFVLSALSATAAAKFKFVELAGNTPLTANIEGDYMPINGLKAGEVRNFGGIDFKVGDSVMRLDARKKTVLKVPASRDSYKYLYILSNRGDKIKKDNPKKNVSFLYVRNKRSEVRTYPKLFPSFSATPRACRKAGRSKIQNPSTAAKTASLTSTFR